MHKAKNDSPGVDASSSAQAPTPVEFDVVGSLLECLYTSLAEAACRMSSESCCVDGGESSASQRKAAFCVSAARECGAEFASAVGETVNVNLLSSAARVSNLFPSCAVPHFRRALGVAWESDREVEDGSQADRHFHAALTAVASAGIAQTAEETDLSEAPSSLHSVSSVSSFSPRCGARRVALSDGRLVVHFTEGADAGDEFEERELRVLCACVALLRDSAELRLNGLLEKSPISALSKDQGPRASASPSLAKACDETAATRRDSALPLLIRRLGTTLLSDKDADPSQVLDSDPATPHLDDLLKQAGGRDSFLRLLGLGCTDTPPTTHAEGARGVSEKSNVDDPSLEEEEEEAPPRNLPRQSRGCLRRHPERVPSPRVVSLANIKNLEELEEYAASARSEASSSSSSPVPKSVMCAPDAGPPVAVAEHKEKDLFLRESASRVLELHSAVLAEAARLQELVDFYGEFARRSVGSALDASPRNKAVP